MAAISEVGDVGHTSPTESKADSDGHKKSVGWDYGGGCATRCGMERATETKRGLVSCTHQANQILLFQPSLPLIQATLVRGAYVFKHAVRSALFQIFNNSAMLRWLCS